MIVARRVAGGREQSYKYTRGLDGGHTAGRWNNIISTMSSSPTTPSYYSHSLGPVSVARVLICKGCHKYISSMNDLLSRVSLLASCLHHLRMRG